MDGLLLGKKQQTAVWNFSTVPIGSGIRISFSGHRRISPAAGLIAAPGGDGF